MPNLETTYLKLKLKNPVIVASSGLTKSVEKIQDCEKAGAGAVVIKSLFEEVLAQDDWGLSDSADYHPEAYEYMRSEIHMQYGPKEYTDLIREAKEKVNIPVIGSINCVSDKWWPSFAKQIEASGADAIELNVFTTANDIVVSSQDLEKLYLDILSTIKATVSIPVALKIGSYFTSLPYMANEFDKLGLDALVLFNRFTEPDIDINKLELKTTFSFSTRNESQRILRWVALLADKVDLDISATSGIQTSEDVIKMLLAGASTVQIASVLYKNGLEKIYEILEGVTTWMEKQNFKSIDAFRGKLSFDKSRSPETYLRSQFMEKIRNID